MTGSRRWFRYVSDDGQNYAIQLDESNTELVNPNADTAANLVTGLRKRPSGLRPRGIRLSNSDNTVKRFCTVLTPTQFSSFTNGQKFTITSQDGADADSDEELEFTFRVPEKSGRLPRVRDTAKTDGDTEGETATP